MNYFNILLDFVKANQANWASLLEVAPYSLKVKQCPFTKADGTLKYPELYMLSYNQIESDFYNPIVKACRGSIISVEDPNNPKMVCVPFYKFGNHGEGYADDIDWDSATVLDKVDGSLLKFFKYKGESIWVTNNGWNISSEIPVTVASPFDEDATDGMNTFEQLKDYALSKIENVDIILNNLNSNYTYMFELVSPKNRIICTYAETKLILLGIRNKNTYQEVNVEADADAFGLGVFETCKSFNLSSIESVIALCDSYKDALYEGVIIRDKHFNRVKIKCKHYLALKGLKGEVGFTDQKIFEAIKAGAIDDAIGAFPEIEKEVIRIKDVYAKYKNMILEICKLGEDKYKNSSTVTYYPDDDSGDMFVEKLSERETKKIYASWVLNTYPEVSSFLFECIKPNAKVLDKIAQLDYKEIEAYVSK